MKIWITSLAAICVYFISPPYSQADTERFFIQTGAFTNKPDALNQVNTLRNLQNIDAFSDSVLVQNQEIFRVRVGPFFDLETTQRVSNLLLGGGFKNTIIRSPVVTSFGEAPPQQTKTPLIPAYQVPRAEIQKMNPSTNDELARRCRRLGLTPGSDDFNLCLRSQ